MSMKPKPREIFGRYMEGETTSRSMARQIYDAMGGISNVRDGGRRLLVEGPLGNTSFGIEVYRENPGKLGSGISALKDRIA